MELEVFTLCQQARVAPNGLHIAGTVENLSAPTLSLMALPIFAAVRLRYRPNETGKHGLTFRFADEDGEQFFEPLAAPFSAQHTKGRPYGWACVTQGFFGLTFRRYAVFGLHLELDGQAIGRVPFAIVRP